MFSSAEPQLQLDRSCSLWARPQSQRLTGPSGTERNVSSEFPSSVQFPVNPHQTTSSLAEAEFTVLSSLLSFKPDARGYFLYPLVLCS